MYSTCPVRSQDFTNSQNANTPKLHQKTPVYQPQMGTNLNVTITQVYNTSKKSYDIFDHLIQMHLLQKILTFTKFITISRL